MKTNKYLIEKAQSVKANQLVLKVRDANMSSVKGCMRESPLLREVWSSKGNESSRTHPTLRLVRWFGGVLRRGLLMLLFDKSRAERVHLGVCLAPLLSSHQRFSQAALEDGFRQDFVGASFQVLLLIWKKHVSGKECHLEG
jgi:hypothetical protein